ncbi:MAG: glutamine-hydrolyzing carbamoyl-phosphate synthase small subunit [Alphaproteobacteria bacterium]|nr:glutamine-hydrolyzing carbamoyl-phosphate synthase small subunit [Alphaproteobacteria bacterium]
MSQTTLDRIRLTLETPTALLILEDGTIFEGVGFGADVVRVGEVCFNTSMTGYQEIMTDPSYAGQIITFTFPHIGNTGTNTIDIETDAPAALGMITRLTPTDPSNFRAIDHLSEWLKSHNMPGIGGIDTRALTHKIREHGAPKGVIAVNMAGEFDRDALVKMAKDWPGLAGMDLARDVTRDDGQDWAEGAWTMASDAYDADAAGDVNIIALDYGCKHNILRCLTDAGFNVRVVPATTSAEQIMAMDPAGIFLSNGPGDPAATAQYAAQEIRSLAESGLPVFGICIGHQLIAEAFGASTYKMDRGHRGANHPVKDLATGKIEITSQNHGFAVDASSLPPELSVTHISLFDGSVEGLKHNTLPVFSVQYHPESSPGPHDSQYLFQRFIDLVKNVKRDTHAAS